MIDEGKNESDAWGFICLSRWSTAKLSGECGGDAEGRSHKHDNAAEKSIQNADHHVISCLASASLCLVLALVCQAR